jgi:YD repeat-containing protein
MLRIIERGKKLGRPSGSQIRILTLIFGLLAAMAMRAEAGNILYVYDNGDRLLAAFDGNGNVANYQYDRVGNITAIVRSSISAVAVFGYSPDHAVFGTQVTIFGNNFSTTPSQNTVKFGTASASVVSSTATTIVATVPTIIGPAGVTVTCPAGTATGPYFFQP